MSVRWKDIKAIAEDSDLAAIAALATTPFGRGLLTLADAGAAKTTLAIAASGAMTQTYSTADPTLGTPTAVAVATTAATNVGPYGYSQAQADAIRVNLNALRNDVLDLAQFVNALVDKLQSVGIIS